MFIPWYRRMDFWTLLVGAIAELVIGFGWPDQAALLASVAGTVIAALVAGGIIQKETIKASADYLSAYRDGQEDARREMSENSDD